MALAFPEFLQTKTYSALRDRLVFQHGGQIQAGVWDSGDFKVTQGTNMVLNVAAGFALVAASNAGNFGLYHVQNDAALTVTIPAANGTLPRLDQIVIDVSDSTNGGDASDTPALTVVQGTATSGATLANRTGAAALPANTLRIADVLVGPAVTSITTTNIQDRRPWARGFYSKIIDTGGDYAAASASPPTALSTTRLRLRAECTGNVMRVHQRSFVNLGATVGAAVGFAPLVDGAIPTADVGAYGVAASMWQNPAAVSVDQYLSATFDIVPTAGTHLIDFGAFKSGTATIYANANRPTIFVVEEIVRPLANNGTA